jgi:hypothetical protein
LWRDDLKGRKIIVVPVIILGAMLWLSGCAGPLLESHHQNGQSESLRLETENWKGYDDHHMSPNNAGFGDYSLMLKSEKTF